MKYKKNKQEVAGTDLIDSLKISDNFYTKQENRLFTLLLKGLIVYLISAGSIGGALTATGTSFNHIIFNVVVILLSIIISLIYYNKKTENIGDILYLFGIIFFGVFLGTYINSGFYAWMNDVIGAAGAYFNLNDIGGFNQAIKSGDLAVTIAACYIGAVAVIFVNMSVAKKMQYLDLIIDSIIIVILPMYFNLEPSYVYFSMVVCGVVFASIWKNTGRFVKVDNNSVYIRTKTDITYSYSAKAHALSFAQIFVCLLAILSVLYVAIPKDVYNIYRNKSVAKDYSDDFVQTLITSGIAGFFNKYDNVAGISSGRLGGVNSVRLDYETNLKITFVPYAYEPIYIRTFIGGNYLPYSNMWSVATPNNLNRNEFNILESEYKHGNNNAGKGKIIVENIDAEFGEFALYYSDKQQNIKRGDSAERIFYPRFNDINYDQYDNHLTNDERSYWLYVPNDNVPSLINTLNKINIPTNIEPLEKVQYIKKYYLDNIPYTLRPGSTPYRKDFVNYFLDKNQKGYCVHFASAATLMLRYMGIPARYVEGYVFDYSELSKTKRSEQYTYSDLYSGYNPLGEMPVLEAEITDASGHAWVEIFIDGFGWVPVELTPPSSDTENNMNREGFLARLFGNINNENEVNAGNLGNGLPAINSAKVRSALKNTIILILIVVITAYGIIIGKRVYIYNKADINSKLIIKYHAFLSKKSKKNDKITKAFNYSDQVLAIYGNTKQSQELIRILEKAGFSNKSISLEEFDFCIKCFKNSRGKNE